MSVGVCDRCLLLFSLCVFSTVDCDPDMLQYPCEDWNLCADLCFPSSGDLDEYSCACRTGIELGSDGYSCAEGML